MAMHILELSLKLLVRVWDRVKTLITRCTKEVIKSGAG